MAGAAERTRAAGHDAAERAGVPGLHPELVETLGRLRLRTSYGQNVLEHLVECAQTAAMMAAELGADVELARRAAFLHDVGKALTAELGGTHAQVGAELAERCGEQAAVVNAIAAHHDEVPKDDGRGGARPGRRRAVRRPAGCAARGARPVPGADGQPRGARRGAPRCAPGAGDVGRSRGPGGRRAVGGARRGAARAWRRTIAQHIEKDLSFPGEIEVTVVRELRASATAG